MATIETIEKLARDYADRLRALGDEAEGAKADLDDVLARHRPAIRALAKRRDQAHRKLVDAIADSPDVFKKPRSRTLHGVKFGFRKGKGRVEFDDADALVKRIRRQVPELFDTLVKTSQRPVKKALEALSADRLKRLGVTVEKSGDVVFAGPAEGDVDALVEALLKETAVEVSVEEEEAA